MAGRWMKAAVAALLGMAAPTHGEPWGGVGDAGLRSDITLLAHAGLLDQLTTMWPVPWAGVAAQLSDEAALARLPVYIQRAARRVRARAEADTAPGLRYGAFLQGTNEPALIRDFGANGIGKGQAQALLDYNSGGTSVHLALGGITGQPRDRGRLAADDSLIAQRVGPVTLYAGQVSHWWGPGWISSLSYSNNARPIPQVGIASTMPQVFATPLLSWIGPWRAEFLFGYLDGPRVARHTLFDALRVTFNPLPGFEVGLSRVETLCGDGHQCSPIKTYFDFQNNAKKASVTSGQGLFDFKYSNRVRGMPYEVYAQFMNEDSSPIVHSFTSYLAGASLWVPVGDTALRLTGEYTSSIATENLFGFKTVGYGVSYNNTMYPLDGMRYRYRTIGYSLDSDSTLASLQAGLTDKAGRGYTVSLHHARIARPLTDAQSYAINVVTTAPVTINYAEAQVTWPTKFAEIRILGRVQDDQPRPQRGATAAIEASLRFRLR